MAGGRRERVGGGGALRGKRIVLGVSGGIAAYKTPELVRALVKRGAHVDVVMSANASRFVAPLALQAVSRSPVLEDVFDRRGRAEVKHIALADEADLAILAPATANVLAKLAAGMADDLLTTVVLATRAPILVAPAMNVHMWENASCQENIQKLRSRGFHFIDPESGELACGYEGKGRLAEVSAIVEEIRAILSPRDFSGETVLITAGPTEESIDPVRFITNRSSGKMGFALAHAALRRGAEVILISGPTALPPPPRVKFISVRSTAQMREAVLTNLENASILMMAAAVSDYRPRQPSARKIKKSEAEMVLTLERNPDILAEAGKQKGHRILVGFAAETENLLRNAGGKLKEKNLDLIVANDVTLPGAGFEVDTNIVKILDRSRKVEELPLMTKEELADRILDRVARLKQSGGP
jgi:phosphopantothenoylcysteine decarboxylase/phosphopantothenate--cysteine ligase